MQHKFHLFSGALTQQQSLPCISSEVYITRSASLVTVNGAEKDRKIAGRILILDWTPYASRNPTVCHPMRLVLIHMRARDVG